MRQIPSLPQTPEHLQILVLLQRHAQGNPLPWDTRGRQLGWVKATLHFVLGDKRRNVVKEQGSDLQTRPLGVRPHGKIDLLLAARLPVQCVVPSYEKQERNPTPQNPACWRGYHCVCAS